MTIRYELLFTIECLHGYFADHLCKVLKLVPTEECRRMLERYQMIFRPLPNGGAVYFSTSDEIDYLKLFQDQNPFAFTMTSSDASLDNYTAQSGAGSSDASPAEHIFYFNNLGGYSADVYGAPKLLLHAPRQATVPLAVRPRQFSYVGQKPLPDAHLLVMDLSGQRAPRESKGPEQPSAEFPIDLAEYPDGAYRLSVNGEDVLDFYLSDTPAVRSWGLIDIFAGGVIADHVPATHRAIDADGKPRQKTFTISLDTPQTTWRYCVFSQAPLERSYEEYDVIGVNKKSQNGDPSSSSGIQFVRKPGQLTINGRQAVVFESATGIPLLQVPADTHTFTLTPGPLAQRGARSHKLPYATVDALVADVDRTTGRACSAVYVYL